MLNAATTDDDENCKIWNIKVTVIPIVIGIVLKSLKKEWGNWRLEEESKPSRPQHFYDQQEYLEETSVKNRYKKFTLSEKNSSSNNTIITLTMMYLD